MEELYFHVEFELDDGNGPAYLTEVQKDDKNLTISFSRDIEKSARFTDETSKYLIYQMTTSMKFIGLPLIEVRRYQLTSMEKIAGIV